MSGAAVDVATAGAGEAIRTEGLTKQFGRVLALDGLDLAVPAGSIFGLLGPNGAGKTTALRILAGLARPTSGRATVAGVPLDGDRPELRRRIGYLDQDPRFYGWMTGRELLELVGRLHGLEGGALRDRVGEALERAGLAADGRRRIGGYSGGMRQRLGVAQALLHRPEIVILDEPVSSLDPAGRRDVLELIAGLRGSATVLFSTHVLADVERICDRVAILHRGRLVTEGPLGDLLAAHALPIYRLRPDPGQAAAVDAFVGIVSRAAWAGEVTTGTDRLVRVAIADEAAAAREILPAVAAAGLRLDAFERARPTLEEVFLTLVAPPTPDELDGRGFVRPVEVPRP